MNKVIMIGHVATDPEAHTTQSGISQSAFRIAVPRNYKNKGGERDSDFFSVVAWRGNADFCNKYLTKGRKVAVEGSLETRSYDAKDGTKRYVTEIIADHVEILSPRQDGAAPAPANVTRDGFVEVDDDDELPF
jgi:single-strand DNA-binding protein